MAGYDRRRRKVDANQAAIVAALEAIGATVVDLSAVGGGVPDLLVGFRGRSFLFEVKNPAARAGRKRGRRQAETDARQRDFAARWRGDPVRRIETSDEALRVLGAL